MHTQYRRRGRRRRRRRRSIKRLEGASFLEHRKLPSVEDQVVWSVLRPRN
jgi:hypothetical protein